MRRNSGTSGRADLDDIWSPSDLHHVGFSPCHVTMDTRELLPHDFNLALTLRQWAVCFCCTLPRSPLVRLRGLRCSMVPGLSSATIASCSIRLDYLRQSHYILFFLKSQGENDKIKPSFPGRLMVGRRNLAPLIGVRVPAREPQESNHFWLFCVLIGSLHKEAPGTRPGAVFLLD